MKDFAKSIVCNSVTEKEFNTEADLRRWCMDHNYTYTPVGGGYYRLEDDKPGSKRPDLEAHVKAGNSKCGNAGISIVKVNDDSDDFGSSKRKGMYKVIDERGSSLGWFKTMEEAKKEKEFWEKQKTGNKMVGNSRATVTKVNGVTVYYDVEGNEYLVDLGGSVYDNPGFKTKEEAIAYIQKKKTGKSKVGNADPRIASLKQKLQALIKQDDTGALKDVLRLAEDTIKDLKARKEKLMKDVDEIEKDLIGWQDIKTEAKWNL